LAACNVLWTIALLILILVVMKNLLIRLRKENTIMETINLRTKATTGIHAILETGLTIGTSIAGAIVL